MPDWIITPGLTPYPEALAAMEAHVAAMIAGEAGERVWLLEHPPIYTSGTSARPEDLLDPMRFPVYPARRGGEYTYHGPGQRVAYAMLDLDRRDRDVRAHVHRLEEWVIRTLAAFGIAGERRDGLVGVWVPLPGGGYDKIAAIGIRVRRWVTFHGIAVNVDPDLEHFSGIVPCGVRGAGVTSLRALGVAATMTEIDAALRREFEALFGPTVSAASEP